MNRTFAVAMVAAVGCATGLSAVLTAASYTDQVYSKTAHLERVWSGGPTIPTPSETPPFNPPPVFPSNPVRTNGISNGGRLINTGVGLSADGNVYVWGGTYQHLGGGAPGEGAKTGPIKVPLPAGSIRKVSGMVYDVNALDADGHVWGWGNTVARNGTDGSLAPSHNPQRLRVKSKWNGTGPLLSDVVLLTTNDGAGAAVREDGTLWTWGPDPRNNPVYSGNVDQGASQLVGLPDPSKPGNKPVYIKGAESDFFAILENGDVYYWGQNTPTAATPPGTPTTATPQFLDALRPWMRKHVAAGAPYIVAIDGGRNLGGALLSDGSVLTWSNNAGPNGGHAGSGVAPSPQLTGVVDFSYGYHGAIFLKADGSLWGYGNGQADGGFLPPTPVHIDDSVDFIGAGQEFFIWRGRDGRFWGQGMNRAGAIGLPAPSTSPWVDAKREVLWNGRNLLGDIRWA
ncbi:MAG: hypothetical protein LBR21_10405 [Propionibacteriaceae bacterium]|jgi:alpha-tubulin suppressor-like RCC1 family protein|nr:hypothetical protein [Propionibacteriaceae bacterium]